MKKLVSLLLVLVLVFALASVAFAQDYTSPEQGNSDIENDDPGNKSPQTGDSSAMYFVIAGMILAAGALVFCGKKLASEK